MRGRTRKAVLIGLLFLVLTLTLVLYVERAFEAAVQGLKIFLDIVFPSLLPFFVLSEMLLGLGVVHFLGEILEPLMRPLFNVPGAGSFVMSMGLAAGYPMDAVITAKFREAGLCTQIEAERLLAFTNTADPLFIFGAVAVGMFGMPRLGYTLAIAHYAAAMCVGFCYRFYGAKEAVQKVSKAPSGDSPQKEKPERPQGFILIRASRALARARSEDGRSFGKMFGDSVQESVKTLLMVCGFIMLFAVLVSVLDATGIAGVIQRAVGPLFAAVGLSPDLVGAALRGVFEIDVGTAAASVASAPLVQKAVVASAIIGWSGLSVHAQVMSVISGTDIRLRPYIGARLLHALFAAVFTVVLLGPASSAVDIIVRPVFGRLDPGMTGASSPGFAGVMGYGLKMFFLSQLLAIAAAVIYAAVRTLRRSRLRVI